MILSLMLTYQCNFRCRHCMVNSTSEDKTASEEVVEAFIQMCHRWTPETIYILGGEVLLKIDTVEYIVNRVRDCTKEIVVFTNGSFLLNESKKKRVEEMNVTIRISDDRFHREFWSEKLTSLIEKSEYWVACKDYNEDMIPVGRAYEEFKHLQYNMGCSLLTGFYDERYPNHHRCMVMTNGDVNLYCATIEGTLANVFEDEDITYELLVEREKILHNYLVRNVIRNIEDTYMAKLCNECSGYKVTDKYIFYHGNEVGETEEYKQGFDDLYKILENN